MSMYNDIVWVQRGNRESCMANSVNVAAYAKSSRQDVGHFWNLVARRNGTEPMSTNRTGNSTGSAEDIMLNFAESGHPVFR